MVNTTEELRAEFPELTAQIEAAARAEAVQAEQRRLQEIDNIANLFGNDLVVEAKYGENTCNAQELAYRAAMNAAKQGNTFLANLDQDAKESGTGAVASSPADNENKVLTEEEKQNNARANIARVLHKKED